MRNTYWLSIIMIAGFVSPSWGEIVYNDIETTIKKPTQDTGATVPKVAPVQKPPEVDPAKKAAKTQVNDSSGAAAAPATTAASTKPKNTKPEPTCTDNYSDASTRFKNTLNASLDQVQKSFTANVMLKGSQTQAQATIAKDGSNLVLLVSKGPFDLKIPTEVCFGRKKDQLVVKLNVSKSGSWLVSKDEPSIILTASRVKNQIVFKDKSNPNLDPTVAKVVK